MRIVTAIATCSIFLLASLSAHAGEARAQFDRFSQGLQGLDGEFEQRVYDARGELSEQSTGTIALKAPRQFRWEYVEPFPQLIVADGNNIWIYDPDLEQVNVRVQSFEEQGSPLTALIDRDELDRQFEVSEGGGEDSLHWLMLDPRGEDAQFSQARLGFDDDAGLARMELVDSLGQRTEVTFSGWERNPAFSDTEFRFTPPPGVDVVGETTPDAEVFGLD